MGPLFTSYRQEVAHRTGSSLGYVAFVIDALARRIVCGQVSNSLKGDLALNALAQAVAE